MSFIQWAATWKNQQCGCASSEDSDQPGHPPGLIRVFAVHMKKAWVLSYPLSAQRRLWSDWAVAQADLSLRWAHRHFVGFVMSRLQYVINKERSKLLKRPPPPIFPQAHWIYSNDNMYSLRQYVQTTSYIHAWVRQYVQTTSYIMHESCHKKTCLCHMQTTKTQISLWLPPLLFAA